MFLRNDLQDEKTMVAFKEVREALEEARVGQLSPGQVLDRIRVCREAGTAGFVIFDLSPTLRDTLFPILENLP